jgi:hypothetical protein
LVSGIKSNLTPFIARTNSTILEQANALIADGQKAIHFAGTEAREHFKLDAKYGFEELLDVYHFRSGNAGAVQSRYLRRFKSFGEIKEVKHPHLKEWAC